MRFRKWVSALLALGGVTAAMAAHVTDRAIYQTDVKNASGTSVFYFPTTLPLADRACVFNSDQEPTSSSVTSTELGYLSGVTSSVQTQINAKLTSPLTTRGDLLTRDASTHVRLGVGSANTVLASDGTDPSWRTIVNADVNASAAIARTKLASGTANHVLINNASGVMSSEAALASLRGGYGFDLSTVQSVSTGGSLSAITPTSAIIKFTNSGGGTVAINGFLAPVSGNYSTLFIINDRTGANTDILLVHEQGFLTAADRMHLVGSVQQTISVGQMVIATYDTNDSRWKCSAQQPIGTANYATYWDSQGRLAAEDNLAIVRGGTNNDSYSDGSVLYYNSTTGQIDEDNSNLFYNDVTKSFGVGVGTSPDAGGHFAATTGPGAPSSPVATINYAGTGYTAGSPTHDYRFYGKTGSIFSSSFVTPSTVNENLTPTSVSAGLLIEGSGFAYNQGTINYRSYALFNGDTTYGPYAASSSVWNNTGGDDGSATTNIAAGNYSPGDSIEYRFYALFESDSTWNPDPISIGTFSEGGDTFDVAIQFTYTGSGSPSNYLIERNVNGGGFNDFVVVGGFTYTDTNSGWTGGPPSYTNLDYDNFINGTNPTGLSPSSIRHFRDTGGGFNEYKDGNFQFSDDNTGWTAGDEDADLPDLQQYSINLSCAAGTGATDVRWTKLDAGHSYTSHYDDFGSATSGTDDNTMTGGNVLTPTTGYAVHGSGGPSLFEPVNQTVEIAKSNGTDLGAGGSNSTDTTHLALTNSNGTPVTQIGFFHSGSFRSSISTDSGGDLNIHADGAVRLFPTIASATTPKLVVGSNGVFFGQADVAAGARVHTRTNGSIEHWRGDNSSGTQLAVIEAGFNMALGASAATSNNGSVGRLLMLQNTSGNNTVLHLSSTTTAINQGGVLEVTGGKTGADLRIGQWNTRYRNGTASDSSGEMLFQINNDTGSLIDAWKLIGTSVGGLTRFGSSTDPTAKVHISAGTTSASSAPLKFDSGSLMTTAEAGAVEFLTDKLYATITTGAARKEITLNDAALTSGTLPVATTNGRLADSALTSTNLVGGTYTPTLNNTTNLDASTAFQCQYMRVMNTVTVSCKVEVDPTTTLTSTVLGIPLPVASNFGAEEDCAGSANASAIAAQGAAIRASAANDRCEMVWIAGDVTNQPMYMSFSYQVI